VSFALDTAHDGRQDLVVPHRIRVGQSRRHWRKRGGGLLSVGQIGQQGIQLHGGGSALSQIHALLQLVHAQVIRGKMRCKRRDHLIAAVFQGRWDTFPRTGRELVRHHESACLAETSIGELTAASGARPVGRRSTVLQSKV
jgi:hypothetical protein